MQYVLIPVRHVAHEEGADEGHNKLDQPDQDEEGVVAAEVEPVAAQQAKPEAGIRNGCLSSTMQEGNIFSDLGMRWLFDQNNVKRGFFFVGASCVFFVLV